VAFCLSRIEGGRVAVVDGVEGGEEGKRVVSFGDE